MVYGVLDLLAAVFYIVLFTWILPTRSTGFIALVWTLSLLVAAGGIGLFLGSTWGHRIAAAAAVVMLLACALLILALVVSAAYLNGIYDGVGQAGAAIGLVAAALTFEVVGLLPTLQLAHLWRLKRARRVQP